MEKQYSIIFWGNPQDNEGFDSVVESYIRLFESIDTDSDVITDLMIKSKGKYISKQSANFPNIVLSGVNKENNRKFPELGYRVDFKLLICGKSSYGSILLGGTASKITNTFRLQLPCGIDLYDNLIREDLINLFNNISHNYNWFWGALIDNEISKKYKISYNNNEPSTFYLMNYFDDSIVNGIENRITDDLKRKYGITINNNLVLFDISSFNEEGVDEINRTFLNHSIC